MKYYNEEWLNDCIEFNRLSKDKEYLDYSHAHLPYWYNQFSFHDSRIISVEKSRELMTLNLEDDNKEHTRYQFHFYNPKFIEECHLDNAWWLADELYLVDDGCEFHFFVDCDGSANLLGFFTLRCSKIELIYNNKIYSVGKESTPEDFKK